MSRARYFGFRVIQTIVLIWFVMTFLFFFFRLMPGSYAEMMLFQGASPEAVAAFEQKWGLNDPLYVQYWRFIKNMVSLDAGTSLQFKEPVWEYVKMKIFNSFILVAPAITTAFVLGSLFGTVAGMNRDSRLERHGIVPLVIFGSIPEFFLAILMVILFAGILNLFPTSGMISATTQFPENAAWWRPYLSDDFRIHYILPFATVVLRYLFTPTLVMRNSVVEVLEEDFIYYHRLSGMPWLERFNTTVKHGSLPVITLYPVAMTRALGGLVLVETVFNWPGIGFALVQAVLSRDVPVVQFVFFVVAAFVIIANFSVDLIYGVIDPRVGVEE